MAEPLDYMADDREWFARNKGRNYRIRKYIAGEIDPFPDYTDPRWHTIVKQEFVGLRRRFFMRFEGESATGEHALSRLWAIAQSQ